MSCLIANCAALPTANAGQYATSHCKPLLFWLPYKRLYNVNVRPFNPLTLVINVANKMPCYRSEDHAMPLETSVRNYASKFPAASRGFHCDSN